MKAPLRRRPLVGASLLLLIASCGGDAVEAPPPPPNVKVFAVGKRATGQSRRFSGRVEPVEESALSFGVAGEVVEIIVGAGQTVAAGQLLARLDDEPLRLRVEEARANLGNARAKQVEAEATQRRIEGLVAQNAAPAKELETARLRVATANGELKAAQSVLERAERDLANTHLLAPFAGLVADVDMDPYQEVSATQPVITLQGEGALKVELLVPETVIRDVAFGQVVRVDFPTLPGAEVAGTVTGINSSALTGNAFPVTVLLEDAPLDLRPGMTASVTFNFAAYLDGRVAWLVPLSALALDPALASAPEGARAEAGAAGGQPRAPLFVLDPVTGTLELRRVQAGELRGNEMEVLEGLEEGELVVSAGVAFLRDGMQARVWTPR